MYIYLCIYISLYGWMQSVLSLWKLNQLETYQTYSSNILESNIYTLLSRLWFLCLFDLLKKHYLIYFNLQYIYIYIYIYIYYILVYNIYIYIYIIYIYNYILYEKKIEITNYFILWVSCSHNHQVNSFYMWWFYKSTFIESNFSFSENI